ncbi:MAG: ATP-binding cassette domain-containing protein [Candidatus Latescibacteria bacterium]|nr:ATP-binding cassette domain-containing protein [Candidatus Latescibacterota bacterium]
MSRPLLEVHGLKKYFPITRGVFSRTVGYVKAVDGVSFTMHRGETLGLVGESGCGKTTAGRSILRLIEATEGRVLFNGTDVFGMNRSELRAVRRRMQIIFQDPYSSLNPRMTVGGMLAEALRIHKLTDGSDTRERVAELLETVGLRPDYARRYPHEFSGGQRQRIGISRALAVNPDFIVADEPVSALDVSIQAQIINLLQDLQGRFGLTFLFVAHDLSVVKHISNRIAVMYLGRIVEIAESRTLCSDPQHPYTRALLSAVPEPDPRVRKQRTVLTGDVPSPANVPPGCPFHPRCPEREDACTKIVPELLEIDGNHSVACILRTRQHLPSA